MKAAWAKTMLLKTKKANDSVKLRVLEFLL